MASAPDFTEADILDQVVAPGEGNLSRQAARSILKLRFNDSAQRRLRRLLAKNNAGRLSESERRVLENYIRVGQFIDLIQAKARLSLKSAGR